MTTILGIRGYDPIIKKEYVLLASDTMWSVKSNKEFGFDSKKFGFDSKKIFYNQYKNLLIGHAGTEFFGNRNSFKEKRLNAISDCLKKPHLKESEVQKTLKKINADNSFIFGLAAANKISLNSAQDHYFKIKGKKLFRYRFKESNILYYSMIGSGNLYAFEKIKDFLESSKKRKNDMIVPLKDTLINFYKGLIEATKKDGFTGGEMDVGVLTKAGVFLKRNFANLNQEEDFYEIKERNIKEIKEEIKTSKKSLDKILLRD